MKKILLIMTTVALIFGAASCKKGAENETSAQIDSLAIANGILTGTQLAQQIEMAKAQGFDLDVDQFLKGFKSTYGDTTKISFMYGQQMGISQGAEWNKEGISKAVLIKHLEMALKANSADSTLKSKLPMTPEQAGEFLNKYYEAKRAKEMEAQYGKNKTMGKEAMDKFAKEEGVQRTESGMLYKYVKQGTGKSPVKEDKVRVSYKGTLVNGEEFDAGENVEFFVQQVVPGWIEILQLMKEGDQIIVYIPYDLAYGAHGNGRIEPFSTLIFDMTLHQILPAEQK